MPPVVEPLERRTLFIGCVLVAAGVLLNPCVLSIFAIDGSVSSTPVRVIVYVIEGVCIAAGAHQILSRRRPRAPTRVRAAGYLLAVTSVELVLLSLALFAILEVLPSRFRGWLERFHPYYVAVGQYEFDAELMYRGRPLVVTDFASQGELFHPRSRIQADPLSMRVVRDAYGHRNHQFRDRAEVVVLGDSWALYGADANDTFGARLEAASGFATHNLAVGGYGPPQYVVLFQRYGRPLRPKFALLCFYEGNDIEDIRKYVEWRETGGASGFQGFLVPATSGHFFRRYGMALVGTVAMFGQAVRPPPEVLEVDLAGQKSSVALAFRNDTRTPEELLKSKAWREFESALRQFKNDADAAGVTPVMVFFPTLEHVYGEFTTTGSDASWRERRELELSSADHRETAAGRLANEIDVRMVSLTPTFKAAARQGSLLYHRSDSHWNASGRELAATFIARELRGRVATIPPGPRATAVRSDP